MKWVKILIIAIIASLAIAAAVIFLKLPFSAKGNDGGFKTEVIVENLDTPWAIDFLPDNTMIFTERKGTVSVFDGAEKRVAGQIDANEESESGLLGIAVDPEFEKNRFVYVYYTYAQGNKISRFVLEGDEFDELALKKEFVLLDGIPNERFHDGGRLKFGPNGNLYATTGDATVPSSAQDIDSLAGKILRLNKDGTAPEDNPFGNYVYSYGHRNPQGLAWDVGKNIMYASEHGSSQNDEINIIEKGKNYGWPDECDKPSDKHENPIRCYSEFTLAPSGIAFHGNFLYIAGLRGTQLRLLDVGGGKNVVSERELISNLGRIRDVVFHDGNIYIATSNRDGRGVPRLNDDKIIRLIPLTG